jgi:DNA-binding winged helix-turn-helix (wHTH) protein
MSRLFHIFVFFYIMRPMTGEKTSPIHDPQDAIKVLLDAGESFYREADPEQIASLVVDTIFRSLSVDAAAILEVNSEEAKVSIYKSLGKLSFEPGSLEFKHLAKMMKFKPRICSPVIDANHSHARLPLSAMIYPVQRGKKEYIFLAERIAEHPSFQSEDLDVFTILVRQAILAIENASLAYQLSCCPMIDQPVSSPVDLSKSSGYKKGYSLSATIKKIGESKPSFYSNQKNKQIISLGNETSFDPERRMISAGQNLTNLTPAESNLIAVLYHSNQQVISHEDLVSQIQGYCAEKEDAARILRPLVCRLRKKIEQFSKSANWIQNVRGTGYRIDIQQFK